MKRKAIVLDNETEELLKELNPDIFKRNIQSLVGGMFLLGMDMGNYCHSSSTNERIAWLRRNFPTAEYIIEAINLSSRVQNICPKCENENSVEANFCQNCGEKLKT